MWFLGVRANFVTKNLRSTFAFNVSGFFVLFCLKSLIIEAGTREFQASLASTVTPSLNEGAGGIYMSE